MWFQDGEIRRGVEPFTISLAVRQSLRRRYASKVVDKFVSR
jgi:hypothetical protein